MNGPIQTAVRTNGDVSAHYGRTALQQYGSRPAAFRELTATTKPVHRI